MHAFEQVHDVLQELIDAGSEADLASRLADAAHSLGFHHFALAHHVDVRRAQPHAIRIHNYPDAWVEFYEANALGVTDPVHRGAQMTSLGFAWSRLPHLITMTRGDHEVLRRGAHMGIGDGFTVPAHVPGEIHGSCSFANPRGIAMPEESLNAAQLVGAFAFEAARKLWRMRAMDDQPCHRLTDRQREVLIWTARGKTDWEISLILGIKHDTVERHMKMAREAYGVSSRTKLAVQALFDGTISFADIMKR